MAVRIEIRPRLTLPAEPAAKAPRRWRLPPLALPAVLYWLGMAALTYAFAHLGQPGLAGGELAPDPASGLAPADEPEPSIPLIAQSEPASAMAPEPEPSPAPETETEPELASAPEPEPARERAPAFASVPEPEPPAAPTARRAAEASTPLLDFPEFTDAPRAPRERASDGPRIDSLFPRAEHDADAATGDDAAGAPPASDPSAPAVLTSCEAAIARNNEQLELGAPRGPADLSRGQYASILERGSYLSACSIPARTVVEICAAVKEGRALGITVTSNPPSAALSACVRRAVSRLKFPTSPRLDVTRTRFDAAH